MKYADIKNDKVPEADVSHTTENDRLKVLVVRGLYAIAGELESVSYCLRQALPIYKGSHGSHGKRLQPKRSRK